MLGSECIGTDEPFVLTCFSTALLELPNDSVRSPDCGNALSRRAGEAMKHDE
jgi:hypothetical protein